MVLEVGPGLGMMTLALADQAKRVVAVEIDSKLVEILKKKVGGYPHVEVIQKDILEMDFKQLHERGGPTHQGCRQPALPDIDPSPLSIH